MADLTGKAGQKEEGADKIQFYDDRTEGRPLSQKEMLGMALIGLASPIIGHALEGRVGGYAGAAAGAKGIHDALKIEDDHYRSISKDKQKSRSALLTKAALQELEAEGAGGAGGKMRYQWVQGWDRNGKPAWIPVDRITKQADYDSAVPLYNTYEAENRPVGDPAPKPAPKSGAKPQPKAPGKAPSPGHAGDPAGFTESDDSTFNYDGKGAEPKPTEVAGKLPSTVGPQPQPQQPASPPPQPGEQGLKIRSGSVYDDVTAEIDDMLSQVEADLDPNPREGESRAQAKSRVEDARKRRDKLSQQKAELQKEMRQVGNEIAKEKRSEERNKRLIDYRGKVSEKLQKMAIEARTKARSGGDAKGEPLPLDKKKQIEALSGLQAKKMAIRNQMQGYFEEFRAAKDKDTQIRIGRQMLKVLNSPEGADAVGAEEVKRLGEALEVKVFNWKGPGPIMGRDLEGFAKQVEGTIGAINRGMQLNQQELDKLMGRESDLAKPIQSNLEYQKGEVNKPPLSKEEALEELRRRKQGGK